jgi:hypothetical protein
MSRIGLRRAGPDSDGGDPLDGLVNLFDIGIVLAVAFLVAGLSLGASQAARDDPQQTSTERTVTTPRDGGRAQGAGTAVGTVYRLPDGRLVLADPPAGGGTGTTPTP